MEQLEIVDEDRVPASHRIVIVGGGFGSLYAAKALGRFKHIKITLVDKHNFHFFQPLLYQVATGKLSGFLAWLIWVFAYIYYLIEFDNKLIVMIQRSWNYFSRKGGSRLNTQEENPLNHSELGGKLG